MPGVEVSASWSIPGESLSARPCGENLRMPLTFPYCTDTADIQPIHELIAEGLGSAPVLGRTTTSRDGTFLLEGLPEGVVALWALSSEGVVLSLDVETGQRDVTLVLAPGVSAQGRVVDERLSPVANAHVTLFNVDHSRYFEAFTDAEGRFTLERLPHWDPRGLRGPFPRSPPNFRWLYGLAVSSPGLLPVVVSGRALDEFSKDDIVMSHPRRIAGRVLLGERPVVGAHVESDQSRAVLVTDEEGRFLLEDVQPGAHRLRARHGDQRGQAHVRLHVEQRQAEVTLRLGTLVRVEGRVRDEEGQPISDATVHASSERDSIPSESSRTKQDGSFVLEYVHPGPMSFVASRSMGFLASARLLREVSAGMPPVELVMKRAFVAQGVITDTEGNPLPRPELVARKWMREPLSGEGPEAALSQGDALGAMIDKHGHFRFDLAEPGRYRLTARAEGFLGSPVDVTVPAQDIQVVMHAAARIDGVVVDTRGAPIEDASISLTKDGSMLASLETNSQGRFTLETLHPGRYALQVMLSSGGYRASLPVEILGTERQEVTIRMEAGLSLSGRVVDEKGSPMPRVYVWGRCVEPAAEKAEPEESSLPQPESRAHTDEQGRFTLLHLPQGPCRLTAAAVGYVLRSAPHDEQGESEVLAKAGDTDVTLVMRYQGGIRGRLVREDRSPIIAFKLNDREWRDPRGDFHLAVRTPGLTTLSLEVPGLTRVVRDIQVHPGQDVDLGEVVLEMGHRLRGRVLDARTSEPVSGAGVEVHLPSSSSAAPGQRDSALPLATTKTDMGGTFELSPLERGPLEVKVTHRRYLPHEARQDSGDAPLEVRLTRRPRVEGTLVDRDGQPVSANVEATSLPPRRHADISRADPTDNGHFRLWGLDPGVNVVVPSKTIHPDGHTIGFIPQRVVLGDEETQSLQFKERIGQATLKLRPVEPSKDPEDPFDDVLFRELLVFAGELPPFSTYEQWCFYKVLLSVPSGNDSREGPRPLEERLTFRELPLGRYTYVLTGMHRRNGFKDVMHVAVVELSTPGVVMVDVQPRWVAAPMRTGE
ncbi:carboxypeptidase-like regulatory domain-containing protein [Myxococcus landrumensis]|uniref:Carboxypeptidase regulatory-like domain-containing protein n=1 Tax=Myxococcus landrumensis TaxID=2813577 RepID=A0ABX7N659_9BACT|nr:carboxypeptidase-like regulatory domain-containing protein [Myxococcus landrumus]QSQ14118.1 carboxypeptidase regulatory-like domain-containing protein [Myxococcus landrumus]